MKIENRTVVSLGYTLTVNEDGNEVQIEKTDNNNPFTFLFGVGGLLPEFEQNLEGKTIGDTFDFIIKAENGYGISNAGNIVRIPKSTFANEQGVVEESILQIGNVIPMMDPDGNKFQGLVREVDIDFVVMDFNHPLADKDLHFVGEIFEVRLATLEELQHGHAHGAGGHHH
jgi:FKBP-type peptidyl-prolyl cis-trans isomerase SlyD